MVNVGVGLSYDGRPTPVQVFRIGPCGRYYVPYYLSTLSLINDHGLTRDIHAGNIITICPNHNNNNNVSVLPAVYLHVHDKPPPSRAF